METLVRATERKPSSIDSFSYNSNQLGIIAAALASAGQLDKAEKILLEALHLAKRIEEPYYKRQAFSEISEEVVEAAGSAEFAEKVAAMVEKLYEPAPALYGTAAVKFAKAGQFERAEQVVDRINDNYYKALTFAAIASELITAKQADKVPPILATAVQVAQPVEDPYFKALALSELAVQYAKISKDYTAQQLFSEALQPVKTMVRYEPPFFDIAVKLAEVGEFDRALQVAQSIRDEFEKSQALAEIAFKYAGAGEFDRGLQVGETIADKDVKNQVPVAIAVKLSEVGEFDRAWQLAGAIPDNSYKVLALINISDRALQAGKIDLALQILNQALEIARQVQ